MKSSRYTMARISGIEPRIKIWLEKDGKHAFGAGIRDVLKAVEAGGSIKAAAGLLGRSYRRVWGQIKEMERALGAPLVQTRVGGEKLSRSALTELAIQLVSDYDVLRQRVIDLVEKEFSS
ncbi:MAG: LysR family transcriptional regulator [Pirellulales bacterium]|nr:LysR family transcriptional regulator [Pirellulales bacterium]